MRRCSSLCACTRCPQVQYKTPFMPVMPGHVLAEYNNLDSARKAIQKGKTAAVFVEPVQGGWLRVLCAGRQGTPAD